MFKINSFEDEIYSSMEKSLVKAQTEEQYGFDKLAKAVNYLNSAAIIFEKAGMLKEADEVTGILEDLIKDHDKSESSSDSDFNIEDLGNFNMKDFENLLESTPEAKYFAIAKQILSVLKGDTTLSDEIKKTLHSFDFRDPEVKKELSSKLKTAFKLIKVL